MIPEIDALFPRLAEEGYSETSERTPEYNCLAWAVGDMSAFWWPDSMGVGYWPESAPRDETAIAFVETFRMLGFEVCENADPEPGFEKVAIYLDGAGHPKHAARQLPSGGWTSKLGKLEDIEHATLEALNGPLYGSAQVMLKRKLP